VRVQFNVEINLNHGICHGNSKTCNYYHPQGITKIANNDNIGVREDVITLMHGFAPESHILDWHGFLMWTMS
jgi:hypothetical protein